MAAALRLNFDAGKLTIHATRIVAAACYAAANGLASSLGFGHLLLPPLHWLALVCAVRQGAYRKIVEIKNLTDPNARHEFHRVRECPRPVARFHMPKAEYIRQEGARRAWNKNTFHIPKACICRRK